MKYHQQYNFIILFVHIAEIYFYFLRYHLTFFM